MITAFLFILAIIGDSGPGCLHFRDQVASLRLESFREVNEWLQVVQYPGGQHLQVVRPVGQAAIYHHLADSLYHVREYERARRAYLKVLNADSASWSARLYLGDTFYIFDQYDTARYWFEQALETNPRSWKSWYYYGELLVASGDTSGAWDAAIRSVILNPYGPEGWGLLTLLAGKTGYQIWNPADSVHFWYTPEDDCIQVDSLLVPADFKEILESAKEPAGNQDERLLNLYRMETDWWIGQRPADDDSLFQTRWYLEYLLAIREVNEFRYHFIWTHKLLQVPELGMLLSDQEFHEMVEFFKSQFLFRTEAAD